MTFEFTWTWAALGLTIIFIAAVVAVLQGTCAYLTLLERKISAWAQDRVGPNRVGPRGLLQPIVDGVKFLLKEEIIPRNVDKVFFLLGPMIAMATSLFAFAVVPFGQTTTPPELKDYRAAVAELPRDRVRAEDLARQAQPIWPQTRQEMEQVLEAEKTAVDRFRGFTGVPDRPYPERLASYNERAQFVIAPHVDIGIVFVFAVGSLAVYAVVLGGWSSNSKYSFMGGLRSSAQLISYEIPMGLSVLGVLLLAGSLNLERIIEAQYRHGWYVLFQPLAALLFTTSVFAECNRLPFDLPECEQELVAGYHTEYTALKFGMFMLGEYTHMITTSFIVVILFFGGWLFPGVTAPGDTGVAAMILKVVVIGVKMALLILFYMFIRWTLPRFRFDQLMGLAWKVLMPLALINLVCVVVIRYCEVSNWWLLPLSLATLVGAGWIAVNLPPPPGKVSLQVRGHNTGFSSYVEETPRKLPV